MGKICSERNYNTMQINTNIALEFFTLEYGSGLSYNSIRNVLPASSSYLPHEVRHHNIIKKFMKGAFNLRLPKMQCHAILDLSILFNYLQNMNTDSDMNKNKKIVRSVKWGHLAQLDPNSTNTIFSTNTMGSSSPL